MQKDIARLRKEHPNLDIGGEQDEAGPPKMSSSSKPREVVSSSLGTDQKQKANKINAPTTTSQTPRVTSSGITLTRQVTVKDPEILTERTIQVSDTSIQCIGGWGNNNKPKYNLHFIRAAKNFFPGEELAKKSNNRILTFAAKWKKQLFDLWKNDEKEKQFLFATNNNGVNFGSKMISREKIPERKKLALDQFKKNPDAFGYTKWELQRKHPIHVEIKKIVESKEFRNNLCLLMAEDCQPGFAENARLGDFFISLYEHDDFLSPHSDTSLGSVTIAAHFLVHKDGVEIPVPDNMDSGAVEFWCADKNVWCIKSPVSGNELVVFRTMPDAATHRVTQMLDGNYLRFGITGFFAMPGEAQVLVY